MDRCDVCIGGVLRTMFSGGVGGMSLWIYVIFELEVLRTMFSGGVGGMSLWIDVIFLLEE